MRSPARIAEPGPPITKIIVPNNSATRILTSRIAIPLLRCTSSSRDVAKWYSLVDPGLGRQPQDFFADRVALDLIGAAADAGAELTEELHLPTTVVDRAGTRQHPRRPLHRHHQVADLVEMQRHRQLH